MPSGESAQAMSTIQKKTTRKSVGTSRKLTAKSEISAGRRSQAIPDSATSVSRPYELVSGRRGQQLAIRKRLQLNRPLFARLIAISERSLASIESGKLAGESATRSILELKRLVQAMAEVIDSSILKDWMTTPNEAFDGLKPIELIERGEVDRIWRMIWELKSGMTF